MNAGEAGKKPSRVLIVLFVIVVLVCALVVAMAATNAGPFHQRSAEVTIDEWKAVRSPYGGTQFFITLNNSGNGMGEVTVYCKVTHDGYTSDSRMTFLAPPNEVREVEVGVGTPAGYYDHISDCYIEKTKTLE